MRKWLTIADILLFLLPCAALAAFPSFFAGKIAASLRLYAEAVLPAIFPFLVITRLFEKCGIMTRIGRHFGGVFNKLTGIPSALCGAVLLGLIGGFPGGAACAAAVYQSGNCTKSDAERAAAVSGGASLPLLCGFAGQRLTGQVGYGLLLFAGQTAVGLLWLRLRKTGNDESRKHEKTNVTRIPFGAALTASVSEAAAVAVSIAGFVVFFGTLGQCVAEAIPSGIVRAAALAAFELTAGLNGCTTLGGVWCRVIAAFAVGFGGLSAHFQVRSVLSAAGLDVRGYTEVRLLSAATLPLLAFLPPQTQRYIETVSLAGYDASGSVYVISAVSAILMLRAAAEADGMITRHRQEKKDSEAEKSAKSIDF